MSTYILSINTVEIISTTITINLGCTNIVGEAHRGLER